MGKVIINDTTLISIADAIREKNGETVTYLPSEMPDKIKNIEGGGGMVKITNGDSIFSDCHFHQGLFDVCDFTNNTVYTNMFYNSDVESIKFKNFCSDFVDISYMFSYCTSIKTVDFSEIDVLKINTCTNMFSGNSTIENVILPNCYFNQTTINMFYDSKNALNHFRFKDGCSFLGNKAQTLNLTRAWTSLNDDAINGFNEFANTIGDKVGANKTIKIYTYLYQSNDAADAISTLTSKGYIVSYGNS